MSEPSERLYVDSSAIIIGLHQPQSNSALVLKLVAEKRVIAFTSEKTLLEVRNHFLRAYAQREAYLSEKFVRANFSVVPLDEVGGHARFWRGKIKDKDLAHLATAKALRLPVIVAFDRDFKPFEEYRTPKAFLKERGIRHYETEY